MATRTPELYLAPSSIQGIGVHTSVAIPKGRPIFSEDEVDDSVLVTSQPPEGSPLRMLIDRYGVQTKEGFWIPADFHRMGIWWFFNHAEDASVHYAGDEIVASRDLSPGDELTLDYRTLDSDFSNLDFQP